MRELEAEREGMVLVRREDLQKAGDASGWDLDEDTYSRLRVALKGKP